MPRFVLVVKNTKIDNTFSTFKAVKSFCERDQHVKI